LRSTDKIFNRDSFVTALATWLRWRGHTLPHNLLAQRFSDLHEEATYSDLKRAAQAIGVDFQIRKNKKHIPLPAEFPLIAIIQEKELRAIRQIDMQGRVVSSQIGGESALVPINDISAWLQVSLSLKKLHHEIFGVDNAAGKWFWDAFSANWWAYTQAALATAFASFLALASAIYSMQVYDRVIPSDSTNTLMVLTIGVVIVYAIELVLKTFRAYVVDYAGKK